MPDAESQLSRVNLFFSNEKPGRRSLSSTSGDFGKLISKSLARAKKVKQYSFRKTKTQAFDHAAWLEFFSRPHDLSRDLADLGFVKVEIL